MDRPGDYNERLPLPELSASLRTVWVQRTGPRPALQRHLPTGGVEIHWPIGATPFVIGPLTAARLEVLPAGHTIVGVRCWPGAAARLLGVPADELVDQVVPLDEVWRVSSDLTRSLADEPSPNMAVTLLQTRLLRCWMRAPEPDLLVAAAVRCLMPWPPTCIRRITEDLAISESQLRRRFRSVVGLGPKALQRTLRLQGYLALAQSAASGSRVADLAAEVGYADHAHLSRECRRLTGQTPRELLNDADDNCGCGHDHAASYKPFLAGRAPLAT